MASDVGARKSDDFYLFPIGSLRHGRRRRREGLSWPRVAQRELAGGQGPLAFAP